MCYGRFFALRRLRGVVLGLLLAGLFLFGGFFWGRERGWQAEDLVSPADFSLALGLLQRDLQSWRAISDKPETSFRSDLRPLVEEVSSRGPLTRKEFDFLLKQFRRSLLADIQSSLAQRQKPPSGEDRKLRFTLTASGAVGPILWKPAEELVSLRLENLGSSTVLHPRVFVSGLPPADSLEALLQRALGGSPAEDEEARAIALWQLVKAGRTHDWPSGDRLEDPVRLLGIYGYSLCSSAARALADLAVAAGLEARVRNAPGKHVVTEIRLQGRWSLFDPDGEVFFRNPRGQIASLEEIQKDPDILRTGVSKLYSPESLREIYLGGEFNAKEIQPRPAEAFTRLGFALRPGESILFSRERRGLFFVTEFLQEPREYANGLWSYVPREAELRQGQANNAEGLQWTVPFSIPYPVLAGKVELVLPAGTDLARGPAVLASRDGRAWTSLPSRMAGDGNVVFDLTPFCNNVGGQPEHAFSLRVKFPSTTPVPRIQPGDLRFSFDLQMAPRSLPLPNSESADLRIEFSASQPAVLGVELAFRRTGEEAGVNVSSPGSP